MKDEKENARRKRRLMRFNADVDGFDSLAAKAKEAEAVFSPESCVMCRA